MASSWRNKALEIITSGALVLGLLPSAALGEDLVLDSTTPNPGYSLTVSGLVNGDTAKYYQIVEHDATSGAWKLTQAVDADGDQIVDGTKDNTGFGQRTLPGPDGKLGTSDDVTKHGLYVDDLVISEYTVAADQVTSDTRQLTSAMANAIATAITNNRVSGTLTAPATDGSITVANAAAGMYMFAVVAGDGNIDTLYKPIFVSTDYYNSVSKPEDNTHTITVVDNDTDYADGRRVFKRSPLQIDKKSGSTTDWQNDVAVGDVIDFEITVPVPTYSENYVAPMFYITDTLTEGLKLDTTSITVEVKNGDVPVSITKDKDYRVFIKDANTDATDYFDFKGTVGTTSTFDAFVVQFLNDDPSLAGKKDGFLYTVTGAPTATIKYKATVTKTDGQKFAQQVNQMDNTAKLEYTKDPNYIPSGYFKTETVTDPETGNPVVDPITGEEVTDTVPDPTFDTNDPDTKDGNNQAESVGELQDKTRHYSFDIDADVLGRDQSDDNDPISGDPLAEEDHDRTSELRKVWLNADGTVDQSESSSDVVKGGQYANGKTTPPKEAYSWLEGAEFSLTQTHRHVAVAAGAGSMVQLVDGNNQPKPEEIKFDSQTRIRVTTGGENPKSDGKGYISMKGLDAGVYILKEVKAPLGYSFNPNIQYEITITPNYVMEPGVPPTPDDGKGGADDLVLESYTVTIVTQKLDDNMNIVGTDPVTTISTYNVKETDGVPDSILNADGTQNSNVIITTASIANNTTAMVINKRLGILPATGGSGIYFYLGIGGVIAAVSVYLIRKTKKAEEQLA